MDLRKNNKYLFTGSSLACVFALGYTSRPKFWRILKGLEEEAPDFPCPAKQYGKDMEPVSRRVFTELFTRYFGYEEGQLQFVQRGNRALSKDYRFGASPDDIVEENGLFIEGAEYKNPYSKPIPKSLNELLSIDTYVGHLLQCILNMECFKVQVWNLFYYRDETGDRAWFRITRNEQFWDEVLYPEALRFANSTEAPTRVPSNFKEKWINAIAKNMKIIKVDV